MGHIRHNAIVITSWDEKLITKAAEVAEGLGLQVLGPSDEVMNGYRSALICPDGSKEGWGESDRGDERRGEFREWLDKQRYADGSSALEWAEVAYGNDDGEVEVIASTWMTTKAFP